MEKFIKDFAEQLLDQDASILTNDTVFRDLDDWDSLTAMAVIAMVNDEYGVKIGDQDFRKLNTIGDIYNHINQNK
jgi:acyl carrier protein